MITDQFSSAWTRNQSCLNCRPLRRSQCPLAARNVRHSLQNGPCARRWTRKWAQFQLLPIQLAHSSISCLLAQRVPAHSFADDLNAFSLDGLISCSVSLRKSFVMGLHCPTELGKQSVFSTIGPSRSRTSVATSRVDLIESVTCPHRAPVAGNCLSLPQSHSIY